MVVGTEADKIADGQFLKDVVDVHRIRYMGRALDSTPVLEVACWRLEVGDSCVTLGSRLLACGEWNLVVAVRTDWVVRASHPRHRSLPCSTLDPNRNDQARISFVSIPWELWYSKCSMTYAHKNGVAQSTGKAHGKSLYD